MGGGRDDSGVLKEEMTVEIRKETVRKIHIIVIVDVVGSDKQKRNILSPGLGRAGERVE